MIRLRDYQDDLVGRIRSELSQHQAVLAVSPTGSGKTVMFSYIASRARERGKRIGIFAHRAELVDQISKTLSAFKVPHGIIAAGAGSLDMRHRVFVISAQTYARRTPNVPTFDLGIIDEAHHCTQGSTWGQCMAHSPDARWIGVTATPQRLDGRGLGESFQSLVLGPSPLDLIRRGALCDYRLFQPSTLDTGGMHSIGGDFRRDEADAAVAKSCIVGDSVKYYREKLNGAPSVAFCVSVAGAARTAEKYREAGFRSAHVDGGMDKVERRRIIADFANGQINVLTSADLISEGFDVPGIHGAILLRPTQSLGLYLQQVGRALRTADGKPHAIILDHVGNRDRFGLPCQEREWSLAGRAKNSEKSEVIPGRECEKCHCIMRPNEPRCPDCGWIPVARERVVDEVAGELHEVDVEEERKKAPKKPLSETMKEQARTRSESGLIDLCIRQAKAKAAAAGRTFTDEDAERAKRHAKHILDARNNGYGNRSRKTA